MFSAEPYSRMLRDFFRWESAGGMMLVAAALLAIGIANSPFAGLYHDFLEMKFPVELGPVILNKTALHWINDGLMAIFFFLVGLEIKREFLEGELSSMSKIALPGLAAIGGMVVPALIYVGLNFGEKENLGGWAIPAATDIAFALAVVSLLSTRVPISLKALLLAIAIFDDLGAIVVIAIFYTQQLSYDLLGFAGVMVVILAIMNIIGVPRVLPYVLFGLVLWVLVLKSGVHATVAGVLTAFAIPLMSSDNGYEGSPLKTAEHNLLPWVAFFILPVFAFANAGVSFEGIGVEAIFEPVTLGIAAVCLLVSRLVCLA